MGKNLTCKRIRAEKDIIIKMYNNDISIIDIAKEYGVASISLWLHLKNWGIKIKRKAYHHRPKKIIKYKLKKSPELQAKIAENTKINNIHIKHCKFVHKTEDQRLVANILSHPIIG